MRRRTPTAIAVCLLAGGLPAASPVAHARQRTPPVFDVRVETVYVDVFVTDRGRPVPGLAATDFELKDNGVAQRVELVSAEAQPLLAVLTFDTSGSLAGGRLRALRAASQAFMESLKPQDEVALFTFAEEIDWWVRPTRDKTRVTSALERVAVGGGTAVVDALYASLMLPVTKARSLLVLFTDGEDNMSWLDWREVLSIAEKSNALVHVVTLQRAGAAPSLDFEHNFAMRQIAEATGGRCWEATSPERLRAAFSAIAEAMSKRYVLSYEPQGVKRPGWHRLDVQLGQRKGDVHARRGYWVADR